MVPLDSPETSTRRVVRAACPHDCPDTCAMLVTVENGRAIEIKGAPDHPTTHGALCTKVARYPERTYQPERVLHPMRRVGAKGEGRFARITWDEALDEIAARLKAIAEAPTDPQAILPYSYAGTMGLVQGESMDRRFFHRLGASLLDRTICSSAGKAGWPPTIGATVGMDVEEYVDSRLILIWGSNSITSNLHFWTRAQEAKRRGAQADRASTRTAARPPTSATSTSRCCRAPTRALALGMMHELIGSGWLDATTSTATRSASTRSPSACAQWPPERVAAICGIDARADRRAGARLRHDQAGGDPPQLRHAAGARRRQRGAADREPACLVGAWRHPAGGVLLSTSGFPGRFGGAAAARPAPRRSRARST